MKIKLISIFVLATSFPGFSQQDPSRAIPLKPCTSREVVSEDSALARVADELMINLDMYRIVGASELIRYRDSLDNATISYHQVSTDVLYRRLDDLTIQRSATETKYICKPAMKAYRIRKHLMCYRTLVPDDKGRYKVHFYSID